jgi:unsaturated rhamnogalacturonyl hydrolase
MSDTHRLIRLPVFVLIITGAVSISISQNYTDAEVLASAIAKGKLAANYWTTGSGVNPSSTDYYADICSFYGACMFGDATGDSTYYKSINNRYNRTQAIKATDIDVNSCGILPLHLYIHNKKEQQLKLGIDAAKANMQKNGYVRNAIDDTYMTGSLHIQAFRATKDSVYLNFFADYLSMYMKNLQQNNGLYWHHKDLAHQFWGRGNGWGAVSSAEMLQTLPSGHPKYQTILTYYKKHMKGLIDVQLQNGIWHQLLGSTSSKNWEETSGSSMFVFALFIGLQLGILDKETYLEPAKKGWMAVAKYLDASGKLNNVAEGFWPKTGTPDDYLDARKAAAGNSHGTAGFLWAAAAVVKYFNSQVAIDTRPALKPAMSVTSDQYSNYYDLIGRTGLLAGKKFNSTISAGIVIESRGYTSKSILHVP